MAKRSKKEHKSEAKLQGFVVVAFAKDWEQARDYETLLRVNDIPAVIGAQEKGPEGAKEIAVMVPEESLDEAHVIIESQNAYDDYYDFAMEEEQDSDFDSDLFQDDY